MRSGDCRTTIRRVLLLITPMPVACADEPPPTPCGQLEASACASTEGCSEVRGNRLDADAGCAYAAEAVGCHSQLTVCGAAFTFGRIDAGAYYRFPSTCQPRGWMPVEFDVKAVNWPTCSR